MTFTQSAYDELCNYRQPLIKDSKSYILLPKVNSFFSYLPSQLLTNIVSFSLAIEVRIGMVSISIIILTTLLLRVVEFNLP